MDQALTGIYRWLSVGAAIACVHQIAFAEGPTSALPPDKPVSLFVVPPAYIYRPPGVMVQDTEPASGASDVEVRVPPSIERPDDWACRTSNVLTRSSISRSNDGKSISDYEHLMPKC